MRKPSTRPPLYPLSNQSSELPFATPLTPVDAEANEQYLDYLSLAFAILITKQVSLPTNESDTPYIFYSL
jgi:hypothetical protein